MLHLLSAAHIKQWDAYTIQHEPVASIDLMERASSAFADWFTQRFNSKISVGVVCGTGNNGGDGLVVARILSWMRYPVTVWVVRADNKETPDFAGNLKRLPEGVERIEVTTINSISFTNCDVLIDALFGSGLNRPPEGLYADVIHKMNEAKAIRVAVDVPSGLFIDSPTTGFTVKAHHTVSFQTPKLAFLLPQNAKSVGEWHIVNIGLSRQFLNEVKTDYHYVEKHDVQSFLKPRTKFDHKGTNGKALLVAGSYGKIGAAVLAAKAVMRAGAGLLTTHIPKCGYEILQSSVPESMVSVDSDETRFTTMPDSRSFDAVGIGPGLGQASETRNAFHQLLKNSIKPLVIDADALNLLATHRELTSMVPADSILTPHPGEFARLAGEWKDDFQRLRFQQEFSHKNKCIVVLKGAHTSISTPNGNVYFNSTGNPGMATGGSGDVLTGILTSLLAQGYEPAKAALVGVYLHGLAGDMAALKTGYRSLVASDIINALPAAYRDLEDYLSQD